MYNQGSAIKIALIRTNKTQKQLAEMLGVSSQIVSRWALCKSKLPWKRTEEISLALGLKLSEFIALGE
jgi:transcriptional regulator with XRE-family HTH domain